MKSTIDRVVVMVKKQTILAAGAALIVALLSVLIFKPSIASAGVNRGAKNGVEADRQAQCNLQPSSVYGAVWINGVGQGDGSDARWGESLSVGANDTVVDATMWTTAYNCTNPRPNGWPPAYNVVNAEIFGLGPAPGGQVGIGFPYGNSIYRGNANLGQWTDPPGSLRVQLDITGLGSGCYTVAYSGTYRDNQGTGISRTYFTTVCINRPAPANPPNITGLNPRCVGNESKVDVSWSGDGSAGWWVDLDNDGDWSGYIYAGQFGSGTNSATVPDFGLQQGAPFWVRVYSNATGQFAYAGPFTAANCFNPTSPRFTHACSGSNLVVNISWDYDTGGGQYYVLLGYGPNPNNYAGWARDNIPNGTTSIQLPSDVGAGSSLDPNRNDYYVILDYKRTGHHFGFYIGRPPSCFNPAPPRVTQACAGSNAVVNISWDGDPGGGQYYMLLGYGPNPNNYAGWARDNIPNGTTSGQVPSFVNAPFSSLDPNRSDYYVILDYKRTGHHFGFYIGRPRVCQQPVITPSCVGGVVRARITWQTLAFHDHIVDISDNESFGYRMWNRNMGGGGSVDDAPNGFNGYPTNPPTSGPLVLNSDQRYYVRVYYTDGAQHQTFSPPNSFVAPRCPPPAPIIDVRCDDINGEPRITITWQPKSGNNYYVDISDNESFGYRMWNKGELTSTTTTAPEGFNGYPTNPPTSGPLVLNPGQRYYVRVWYTRDSIHSLPSNFVAPNCSRPFRVTPSASTPALSPDDEAPIQASFNTSFVLEIDGATGTVQLTATRRYYIDRASGPDTDLSSPPAESKKFNEGTTTYSGPSEARALPALQPGDQVCVTLTVAPGRGMVDSAGNVTRVDEASRTTSPPACVTITNKPYLKIFGGSVWAGSRFADAGGGCSGSFGSGLIKTYAIANGAQPYGSSAQYAAMALGEIVSNGFFSASKRSAPENGSTGYLTIANNSFSLPTNWGGSLGQGHCLVDFYDPSSVYTRFSAPSAPAPIGGTSLSLNSPGPADGGQYQMNGNVTLSATSSPTNKRFTIYINGNAFINNDIRYNGVYPFLSSNNIPYVTVIVRGNIYINKNVNILSGLYIAQPRADGTGGEIFTCADSFARLANDQIYSQCGAATPPSCNGRVLEIYGAFIAKKVNFHRSNASLRCAKPGAYPEPFNSPSIAEKFYLAPELYIGEPVFRTRSTSSSNDFGGAQSYSNLPPIF